MVWAILFYFWWTSKLLLLQKIVNTVNVIGLLPRECLSFIIPELFVFGKYNKLLWNQLHVYKVVYNKTWWFSYLWLTLGVEEQFGCNVCGKTYRLKRSLWRHHKFECGKDGQFMCHICGKRFRQNANKKLHLMLFHNVME